MDQDIKKRWVDALRSGDYSQTKNLLADSDGYCCLGVLCEIAVQDGVVYRSDGTYFSTEDSHDYSSEELPRAVQEWAGLDRMKFPENPLTDVKHIHPHRPSDRETAHFSELNDDMGYDFAKIADVIDRAL